jgi:hypothetical protein
LEDDIKMDCREIGFPGVDWIYLAPVADSCENSNEPSGSIKGGEFLEYLCIMLASQEGLCSM